jgi:phosphate transport system substrate-binding protein
MNERSIALRFRTALSLAVVGMIATACLSTPAGSPTPDPLAGVYRGHGGGGALPQVQALTKRFSELHPGVVWDLTDVGSDSSVQLTQKGETDFGFISRELKPAEQGSVKLDSLGVVGSAVVVNAKNKVTGLTKDQVRDIFSGKITDWAQVGGDPGKIKVIVREMGSATRSNFEAFFFGGKATYSSDAIEIFEIDETLKTIYSLKDAIGMATVYGRTLSDTQIRLLAIDGVAATRENLVSGAYKIRRPLYLITNLDATKLKPAIKAFLDFVRGPDGQAVLSGEF